MPSKKRKYNARFPAGRIKKIMQTDEEVGKVAQAVPVIISRTLELFIESLLTKAMEITNAKNAKTLSPSHMKQCILSESRFDFLKDLVKNIPDVNNDDNQDSSAVSNYNHQALNLDTKSHTSVPAHPHGSEGNTANVSYSANFYTEQSSSGVTLQNAASVIQYQPKIASNNPRQKADAAVDLSGPPKFHLGPKSGHTQPTDVPPLIPIIQQPPRHDAYNYGPSAESLCIDEDYDN